MKNVFNSFLNAVIWVVIVLLLFLVGSGLYQHFFNQEKYTGFLGIGYAVVVSGSMEPNIHVNDMILYQRKAQEDYEVGDPIVYAREKGGDESMLITHRIISIDGDTLVTQGDANSVADDPIEFSDVVGRVVWRIPKIGIAVDFVKTPVGLCCVAACVVILFILNIFLTKGRNKKRPVKTVMGDQYIEY